MNELVAALGLVLVIEGLIWALSPDFGRRMLALAASVSEGDLRRYGWGAVGLGLLIVWAVRG